MGTILILLFLLLATSASAQVHGVKWKRLNQAYSQNASKTELYAPNNNTAADSVWAYLVAHGTVSDTPVYSAFQLNARTQSNLLIGLANIIGTFNSTDSATWKYTVAGATMPPDSGLFWMSRGPVFAPAWEAASGGGGIAQIYGVSPIAINGTDTVTIGSIAFADSTRASHIADTSKVTHFADTAKTVNHSLVLDSAKKSTVAVLAYSADSAILADSAGKAGTATTLSGILSLAHGGTNANLTASNGGIVYSTASAGAILSGTATANQILLSGASTTPAWSTATYPATAGTSGNVLTSNGTNWASSAPSSLFSVAQRIDLANLGCTITPALIIADTTTPVSGTSRIQNSGALQLFSRFQPSIVQDTFYTDIFNGSWTLASGFCPGSSGANTQAGLIIEQHINASGTQVPAMYLNVASASTFAGSLIFPDAGSAGVVEIYGCRNGFTYGVLATSGTNQVGGPVTIAAGAGTGRGVSGQITFRTAKANASGSSVQTLGVIHTFDTSGEILSSKTLTITTNAATCDGTAEFYIVPSNAAVSVALTAPTGTTGRIIYVRNQDATAATTTLVVAANSCYEFVYDGSAWVHIN